MNERETRGEGLRPTSVIEWYRVDLSRRLLLVLVPCMFVLTVGLIVSAGVIRRIERDPLSAYSGRRFIVRTDAEGDTPAPRVPDSDPVERALFAFGFVLVVAGPLGAILGLRRVVTMDEYVLVSVEGLWVKVGGTERNHRWEDVEQIRAMESRGFEIVRKDDSRELVEAHFAGIDTKTLVARLEDVRRKAIWNLLPEQRQNT